MFCTLTLTLYPLHPVSIMLLHPVLVTLGLAASVSAAARPRDDQPVPEPLSYHSTYSNAAKRWEPLWTLVPPLPICTEGYHACCEQQPFPPQIPLESFHLFTTYMCAFVCSAGPPQGKHICPNAEYYVCPSQDFCCRTFGSRHCFGLLTPLVIQLSGLTVKAA